MGADRRGRLAAVRRVQPGEELLGGEGVVLRADLRGRESSSGMDVVLRGRAPSSMMAISPDGAKSRPVCMDPRGVRTLVVTSTS